MNQNEKVDAPTRSWQQKPITNMTCLLEKGMVFAYNIEGNE